jgi:hypothetical protein
MNLTDFNREYDDLSQDRRFKGVKKLFDTILSDTDRYEDIIYDILDMAVNCEEDDYFGTEGLDV